MGCKYLFPAYRTVKASKVYSKIRGWTRYYYCLGCNRKRLYKYRHTKRGAEMTNRSARARYRRNKEKAKARAILNNEIKKGIMFRPTMCPLCMTFQKTEAHHEDYSKPLEVKWMCKECHRKQHRLSVS